MLRGAIRHGPRWQRPAEAPRAKLVRAPDEAAASLWLPTALPCTATQAPLAAALAFPGLCVRVFARCGPAIRFSVAVWFALDLVGAAAFGDAFRELSSQGRRDRLLAARALPLPLSAGLAELRLAGCAVQAYDLLADPEEVHNLAAAARWAEGRPADEWKACFDRAAAAQLEPFELRAATVGALAGLAGAAAGLPLPSAWAAPDRAPGRGPAGPTGTRTGTGPTGAPHPAEAQAGEAQAAAQAGDVSVAEVRAEAGETDNAGDGGSHEPRVHPAAGEGAGVAGVAPAGVAPAGVAGVAGSQPLPGTMRARAGYAPGPALPGAAATLTAAMGAANAAALLALIPLAAESQPRAVTLCHVAEADYRGVWPPSVPRPRRGAPRLGPWRGELWSDGVRVARPVLGHWSYAGRAVAAEQLCDMDGVLVVLLTLRDAAGPGTTRRLRRATPAAAPAAAPGAAPAAAAAAAAAAPGAAHRHRQLPAPSRTGRCSRSPAPMPL